MKNNDTGKNRKAIRNSTVDFLVFTKDASEDSIEVRVQDGEVWLTQDGIAQLFGVDRSVVTKHLKNIFQDGELTEEATRAKFAQVADNGKKRIIQCVMDHSKRYSLFNVVEYGAKRASSSLLFIPLHGNVKYLNSNLYFGKNELANVDTDNKDLFDLMHGELLKVPTLFWGYGFHDNAVERTITKLLQEGHQDIWILCRPGNENIDYFRDLGCRVIEGETLELLDWIEENCSEVQPGSSDPIDTSSLQQYLIPSLNSLEVVTQEDYYAKGITHWFCILSDYAYQTKNVNLLYNDALQRKNVIAVGIPFSGKTTMMMQIAAKAQADIKLLLSNISVEEAQRIINLLHSHRVFSFVDSCCDDVSVTKLLMQQPNFTVLGFTDDYAFESSKHLLDDVPYYRKDITEVEWVDAQGIYSKIPQSLRKSKLEYKKSEDEKYSILELITSNVKDVLSQQRVRGLLDRVKSNSETTFQIIALSAYLTCNKSCLNMDVLCSFLGITDYHILKKHIDATQSYLREIDVGLSQDINNQDYYELRSNLFAWLAYDELRKHFQKDFGDIVSKFILSLEWGNTWEFLLLGGIKVTVKAGSGWTDMGQ